MKKILMGAAAALAVCSGTGVEMAFVKASRAEARRTRASLRNHSGTTGSELCVA